jgi:hypothetical protein
VSFGTEDAVRRPDRSAEVSRGHSRRAILSRKGRPKARTVPEKGLKGRVSRSDIS